MSAAPVVLLTTAASSEEGERIARGLLERRLAACVNVVANVRSVYRWRGEVCADDEVVLIIKTTVGRTSALETALNELHSYELPELVQLDVSGGGADYLSWLSEQVEPREPGSS